MMTHRMLRSCLSRARTHRKDSTSGSESSQKSDAEKHERGRQGESPKLRGKAKSRQGRGRGGGRGGGTSKDILQIPGVSPNSDDVQIHKAETTYMQKAAEFSVQNRWDIPTKQLQVQNIKGSLTGAVHINVNLKPFRSYRCAGK